jgi:gas vesicle protein
MWDRKQIKEIFDKISNGRGYFELFYEILSLFSPDIRNLAKIAGQIMHVMNSNNPVLFYVKSNAMYEYEPLQNSEEACKYLSNVAEEIENSIDKNNNLSILSSSLDRPIQEICEKMIKEDIFSLENQAKNYGRKMFDFQETLLRRGYMDINRELEGEFKKVLSGASGDIISRKAASNVDKQLEQFKKDLKKWKDEQLRILEDKLTNLVPNRNYYVIFGGRNLEKISPQTGKTQAKELAKKIVELVYEKRLEVFEKFRKQPAGGIWGDIKATWGNIKGEMECADWAALFYQELEENIKEYYQKNLNSFRVEWRRRPPFIKFGEHNWIRIFGPKSSIHLVIDPWRSGGKEIVAPYPKFPDTLYKADGKTFAYPKGKTF